MRVGKKNPFKHESWISAKKERWGWTGGGSTDLCCDLSERGWTISIGVVFPLCSCETTTNKTGSLHLSALSSHIHFIFFFYFHLFKQTPKHRFSFLGNSQYCIINGSHSHTLLLTRKRAAGTAGRWRCDRGAAALVRRSAWWRGRLRDSSDNPETHGSLFHCADTRPTAGGAHDPDPERTPRTEFIQKAQINISKSLQFFLRCHP